jgi:hypothetical protein
MSKYAWNILHSSRFKNILTASDEALEGVRTVVRRRENEYDKIRRKQRKERIS